MKSESVNCLDIELFTKKKPYCNQYGTTKAIDNMPSITVKNIPDELYAQLKFAAEKHRRSINSELLSCLEKVLTPQKLTADEHMAAPTRGAKSPLDQLA